MSGREIPRRPLTDVEELQVRYELRLGNTERGIKKALQNLCNLYESRRYLRDPTNVRQLIHSHLGAKAILLRRWSLKALGLIGHPEDTSRIVACLRLESDVEAQTWGAAALLKNADDRGVKEVCEEAGLERSPAMALAARLYAPDRWLRLFPDEQRVSLDDDPLTLKWAIFLVGYDRAPPQLFDPKHANPLFLGELNTHPIPEVSEYSVWALWERREFGISDLKIELTDVHRHPPSVRKWLYRLMLKNPKATGLDPDAVAHLRLIETDISAREGLALGLVEEAQLDFSSVLIDWYQVENDPAIKETLLVCIARRSENLPEFEQLVVDSFILEPPGGATRKRLIAATSGTAIQTPLRKIEADDELRRQGLFQFYRSGVTIIGGKNDVSNNRTTFSAGRDISGQVLAGGDVVESANAAVQALDKSRLSDQKILSEVLGLIEKIQLAENDREALGRAVDAVATSPTKENKTSLLGLLKGFGRGALGLLSHADEIEHVVHDVGDWVDASL